MKIDGLVKSLNNTEYDFLRVYMKVQGPMPSSARSGNGRYNTFMLRFGSKPWRFIKIGVNEGALREKY